MSTIFEAARDCARSLPTAELGALEDALRAELVWWYRLPDLDPHSREVALHLAAERLRAVRAELAHRQALAQQQVCVAPSSDNVQLVRAAAAHLRESVDLLALLRRECAWRPVRDNGREAAGPCPFCGGHDRFIVWPGTGRWWCRRCTLRGDAIDLARALWQVSFPEALERLAEFTGRGQ